MNQNQTEMRTRDVTTLKVLGGFFAIMGTLVLIATYETIGNPPAMIVNVVSGIVLLGVGVGMLFTSRRMNRS